LASKSHAKSAVSENQKFRQNVPAQQFVYSIPVMVATEAEMISAKLLPDERDFCAHKLIDYKACRADVWPFVYKCTPEKHDYLNCQYDE
jgi:hypothetical protein